MNKKRQRENDETLYHQIRRKRRKGICVSDALHEKNDADLYFIEQISLNKLQYSKDEKYQRICKLLKDKKDSMILKYIDHLIDYFVYKIYTKIENNFKIDKDILYLIDTGTLIKKNKDDSSILYKSTDIINEELCFHPIKEKSSTLYHLMDDKVILFEIRGSSIRYIIQKYEQERYKEVSTYLSTLSFITNLKEQFNEKKDNTFDSSITWNALYNKLFDYSKIMKLQRNQSYSIQEKHIYLIKNGMISLNNKIYSSNDYILCSKAEIIIAEMFTTLIYICYKEDEDLDKLFNRMIT